MLWILCVLRFSFSQQSDISSRQLDIPDERFRETLLASGADLDGDGLISYEEASRVTELNLANSSISDLAGIEAFKNLCVLNCDNNQIEELNLSSLPGLVSLSCRNNKLNCLDVSAHQSLEYLYCGGNKLVGLDLSNNHMLGFGDPSLVALDICNMPTLSQVCHWWGMFYSHHPKVEDSGSPNVIYMTTCCPEVFSVDSTEEQGELPVMASKDGIVFLVPDAVLPVLAQVQKASLASAMVEAYHEVFLSIEGVNPGHYLLYAADMSAKLSTPLEVNTTPAMDNESKGKETGWGPAIRLGDLEMIPNPSDRSVRISGNYQGAMRIQVFDAQGKLVYNRQKVFPGEEIDVSRLQPGPYFILLESRGSWISRLLIKN